jgi:hypothetical protein
MPPARADYFFFLPPPPPLGGAACDTFTATPATTTDPFRGLPEFAPTVTVAVPDPAPPPDTLAHDVDEDAVHEQSPLADTVTARLPPVDWKLSEVGDTEKLHAGGGGGGGGVLVSLLRNADTVAAVVLSARALSWLDVPVARPL